MEIEVFLSKLDGVRHQPSGTSARCPSHDDQHASLSVNVGQAGNILVFCHAGCRVENIVSDLGLTMADLVGTPYIADTYTYTDDDGNVLWRVQRWANPKDFRCVPGLPPPAQRKLYRSDALAWARQHFAPIWICEGEKDCNRLAELGFVSTTNVGGAGKGKILPQYALQVEGCPVVIVADNDPAGREHAREWARVVAPHAASVSLVVPRYGGDVSALLDLGWTLDALDPLPEEDELASLVASNVTPRPVAWAWRGYVPLGKVTVIEGDPGDGKSVLSVDLVSRWTSGQAMPDGQTHDGPWPAIMITAEDDPEDTIVPRLLAAGADRNLVRLIDHGPDPSKPFNITTDMAALTRIVMATGAKILVVDPLMAMIGEKTDTHNDSSVRIGLYPLYRLARDTGIGVVAIRHLTKGGGTKAIYRGGGSIAFIGAARAGFAVGRDPEDRNRRIMACVKMNIAPEPPSLAYTIAQGAKGPFLEWHGVVDANAQEILDGRIQPKDAAIILFLNTVVENGKPMSWTAIVERGEDEGYTEKQLRSRRSRSRLVKIVGDAGNRSVRWGYLEHEIAEKDAADQLPENGPPTTNNPLFPLAEGGVNPASDGPFAEGDPSRQEGRGGKRRQEDANGRWDEDDEEAEEYRRDTDLGTLPLVCQVCATEDAVCRFGRPFWVVRCANHNPNLYRGES